MKSALLVVAFSCAALGQQSILLDLRSRVQAFKSGDGWQEARVRQELPVAQTAVLICDMWDKHWCKGASQRVEELVKIMAPVVDRARARGMMIIHSPSEVMGFYKDTPQRKRMLQAPPAAAPGSRNLTDPPLPIDDSDGGCDTPDQFYKAWTRQHPGIRIAPEDGISDNGQEVYNFLFERGIKNLLVMGVHTNMCVLKRSFAIRQMTNWGIRCVLVRDLTDTMYDPKDRPFVKHDEGTELVVQHIEKYWCPSIVSTDLLGSEPFRFAEASGLPVGPAN